MCNKAANIKTETKLAHIIKVLLTVKPGQAFPSIAN